MSLDVVISLSLAKCLDRDELTGRMSRTDGLSGVIPGWVLMVTATPASAAKVTARVMTRSLDIHEGAVSFHSDSVVLQVKPSFQFNGCTLQDSNILALTFALSHLTTAGGTILVMSWYQSIVV